MSDQDNGQVSTLQRPTTDDPQAWEAYWKAQGRHWRTEPEIDAERQKYLAERRAIVPDIEKGMYPFKDIKLSRSDIEWLLATHENGRGPVDWSDESQQERKGLDLRGADLRRINLDGLPLASIRGGLDVTEWRNATPRQRASAGVHLEGTSLWKAHLEGVHLRMAHLEESYLRETYLTESDLTRANLEGTYLRSAHLEWADLRLSSLKDALLYETDLKNAILRGAHLEGTDLRGAHLERADLRGVIFDIATKLERVSLSNEKEGTALLADVHWGDAALSGIDWLHVKYVGDEHEVLQKKTINGEVKDLPTQINDTRKAVIANRHLAVALQSQGLNEDAARFAYRAQKLQRVVLRFQKKFGQYLFSLLLDLLAGYGYRPSRSVVWYLATILIFALAYHFLGGLTLYPPDAFVFSVMSFHGRGFFPALSQETNLHNPLVMLAAAEAIIGLLIEISFIATFTQRFFGR